jgi:autotransporter-associated beta strand protein
MSRVAVTLAWLASLHFLAATVPAAAQNATWRLNPGSGNFNSAANWTPNAVPTGTAVFDASFTTAISFSGPTTVGEWLFNPGATAYTFSNQGFLSYTGSGFLFTVPTISVSVTTSNSGSTNFNNNSSAQFVTFTNLISGALNFNDASTAGAATISNNLSSSINFNNSSRAGFASITNNSSSSLKFNANSSADHAFVTNNLSSSLKFNTNSTADNATVTNNGFIDFNDNSTAGNAAIFNNGAIFFNNTSSGGIAASITNGNSGIVSFSDDTTAGGSHLRNLAGGTISFSINSNAGSAVIGNDLGGSITFFSSSSAGAATFSNDAFIRFFQTSTAGSATFSNSGNLFFNDNSTAGGARLINVGNTSVTSFQFSTGPNGDGKLSAGSIEGAGLFDLAANQLTVGGNNLSTTVSGIIDGTDPLGGPGGSLVKIGAGTMTLSGANTYTGGTTVNGGVVAISADNNLGDASGGLAFGGGTLRFLSGFTTNRIVALNAGGGTFDTNGNNVTLASTLSGSGITKIGAGTLTLSAANTYAGGTTVNGGLIKFSAANNFGTGQISLNGGGLQWASGTSIDISSRLAAIGAGGGTFDTNGNNVTLASALSGGGITKIGAGALTLTALNTYAGGTAVNGGLIKFSTAANFGTGAITLDGGGLQWATGTSTDISSRLGAIGPGGGTFDTNGNNVTLASALSGGGALTKTGAGVLTLSAANTYAGGTTVNGGVVNFSAANNFGTGPITLNGGALQAATSTDISSHSVTLGAGGGTFDTNGNNVTLGSALSGTGALTKTGAGVLTLSAANTYSGGTTVNGGTINFNAATSFGTGQIAVLNGGTLQWASGSSGDISSHSLTLGAGGGTLDSNGNNVTLASALSGAGGLTKIGAGTLTLSAANTYAAGTTVSGGAINFNTASSFGTGPITLNAGGLQWATGTSTDISSRLAAIGVGGGTFDTNGNNVTLASALSGGSLTKTGAGTLTLAAANTHTGTTSVNGGTLAVDGSIVSSSVTVNAGMLTGNGSVASTTVNGGTLAPGSGSTLTVQGNLVLASAATYMVQLSGATANSAHVTGTAALAGTLAVQPLTRLTATTTYEVLRSASISGAFQSTIVGNAAFARNARLSYANGSAFLTLDPGLLSPGLPSSSNIGQKGVAAAMDNGLLAGGNLLPGFNALFNLAGSNLTHALTQISGENSVGSQQATFGAMAQFMGVLSDPFIAGRGGVGLPGTAAMPFADESAGASAYAADGRARSRSERDAYAMLAKARPALTYEPRWSVWAAGFGGSQTTEGSATVGSNPATSRIFGTAVGADYSLSANTVAGFALAGGGTNFSVANGLGGGRSDLFQAGAFANHTAGAAYLSGALAYGWQGVITDRTVTVAGVDRLRAEFNAHAFSGRLEGGHRFLTPRLGGIGLTPYAAGQFTTFNLPVYAESVVSGVDTFALAYAAKSATATRSELGVRSDKSFPMPDSILTLRGRAAWAHDFNNDRNIAATFQTLPGASFIVSGAAPAPDAALVTASAERKWLNGWSAAATFEGEFSSVTRSYAGKGAVRYAW